MIECKMVMEVKKSIIKKDIEASCGVCKYGKHLADNSGVLCEKHGIRNFTSKCRKFKYDPLNRVPKKAPVLQEFTMADFEL